MQDIMNKVHSSLTNALHSLDTSSRINWDDLLNEVVRETLSHNNIVGAIKITKNPDIKLDPERLIIYSLLMMQTHHLIR